MLQIAYIIVYTSLCVCNLVTISLYYFFHKIFQMSILVWRMASGWLDNDWH